MTNANLTSTEAVLITVLEIFPDISRRYVIELLGDANIRNPIRDAHQAAVQHILDLDKYPKEEDDLKEKQEQAKTGEHDDELEKWTQTQRGTSTREETQIA